MSIITINGTNNHSAKLCSSKSIIWTILSSTIAINNIKSLESINGFIVCVAIGYVIKICGNPNTYERMQHAMDLNAGRIITGEKTIEEVGEEADAKMLRVLSGEMTKNEAIGYFSAIDIHCLGPVI